MNPSNRTVKEDVEKWLERTIEKENLKNYTINITGSSAKGDNYLGDITFVEVSGQKEDGQSKTYNFVVKCGKKSTELRKIMPIRSAFENEMYFYNEVVPVLQKFQQEKNIEEPFNNVAQCFDTLITEDMEVLILENKKISNYSLWDRSRPMNNHHIKLVLEAYSKLHALSFALRDQRPKVFEKLANEVKDIFKIMNETMETPQDHDVYKDIIKIAVDKNENEIVDKLRMLKDHGPVFLRSIDRTEPYAVIGHGDCWNNNFLFKYKENKTNVPLDVCLLDFQLCRLASPVFDLSYFLFCCISEDDLKCFDELIDFYYTKFSIFLRKLGSDPDKLFPFEELTNQWKKYAKFGLLLMPSIIRICVSEKDEVNDLAEAAESGQKLADTFSYTVKNIEEYERRTMPVLRLSVDKGFI